MTTLREAAAAALEALTVYDGTNGESKRKRVLATLRAALAEPQDEPVAWRMNTGHGTYFRETVSDEDQQLEWAGKPVWTPLYTHPAPQRQPQESDAYRYALGLASSIWSRHYKDTAPGWKPLDDLVGLLSQIDNMVTGLVRQEKAALAEPQEPYCYVYEYDGPFGLHREFYPREYNGRNPDRTVALYTHPAPQRQRLSGHEIRRIVDETVKAATPHEHVVFHEVVRAIERAHGIGGQDE